MLFAEKWNVTPFEILNQDIDDFILIANYMIDLGGSESTATEVKQVKKPEKEMRIRVNDKTATGGWW